jgi:DNA-directed RNA polymerase specialized sigma24 family protein
VMSRVSRGRAALRQWLDGSARLSASQRGLRRVV